MGRIGKTAGARAGTGAFRAQIEEVRAFVEDLQCARNGSFRGKKQAAVAEGVGRDVDHAHNERAEPKFEGTGAEAPGNVHACDQACINRD